VAVCAADLRGNRRVVKISMKEGEALQRSAAVITFLE